VTLLLVVNPNFGNIEPQKRPRLFRVACDGVPAKKPWCFLWSLCRHACVSAGSDPASTDDPRGRGDHLDRDGSRTPTPVLDTLYRGARVALLVRGSVDTFKTATTNTLGTAIFTGVPLGQYRVAIVPASIGDSIQVQAIKVGLVDTNEVQVTFADDTSYAEGRLGYPEFSIREVRNLPLGRRVFIRGVVLAGVQSFRDTTSHVTDSSLAIRLTRVAPGGGLTGNNPATAPGDRHLDLLRPADAGQRERTRLPRLSSADPTAGQHRTASTASWVLDAALIRLTGATISDTATISPDFRVTISDGTGSLVMILDANIAFNRSQFVPGRSMQAVGVLVPDGVGGWVIKPRQVADVLVNQN
jgi:hypothetical protein